jgi:hypothetical protein
MEGTRCEAVGRNPFKSDSILRQGGLISRQHAGSVRIPALKERPLSCLPRRPNTVLSTRALITAPVSPTREEPLTQYAKPPPKLAPRSSPLP